MSTSLRGYCIKLSDLRALVKNPPAGLLEEFDQRFPNPFVAPKRRSKGSPGKPLKELLKTDTEGRLLEKMCAVRGVKIESSCFEDAKLTYVYKALDAGMGGGVCERLKEPRLPLPLPPNDGGPPWISYLTREEIEAMLFGWKVCKHVKSNAIVFARAGQTVGVGAGQMSRVDSVKIAVMKAQLPLAGSVVASDAFFPFPDGVEEAAKAGATAFIQPGGSVRDPEVIAMCDRLGLAMVFCGVRHFRH